MKTNIAGQIDRPNLECTVRTITPRGITFSGLSYASPLLAAVHQMNQAPGRAVIHFDTNDLSHIYIFERQGCGFVGIPCNYVRYAKGLTLVEHRAVQTHRRRLDHADSEETLLEILGWVRSGIPGSRLVAPPASQSTCTGQGNTCNGENDAYYLSLMSRLATEIAQFGEEGQHA